MAGAAVYRQTAQTAVFASTVFADILGFFATFIQRVLPLVWSIGMAGAAVERQAIYAGVFGSTVLAVVISHDSFLSFGMFFRHRHFRRSKTTPARDMPRKTELE